MAMEPFGSIAGTASSIVGFYTTVFGTFAGVLIGRTFDGSVLPLAYGFVGLSFTAILAVLFAEQGRLFATG